MRDLILIILLLLCFVFENVSSQNYYLNIPAQNVSNNQEIKWNKPRYLQGRYDVNMVLFVSNQSGGAHIWLSVGKDNTLRKEYPAVFENKNGSSFTVDQFVTINAGETIRIFYKGNNDLQNDRRSYIHLTETSRPNGQEENGTTNGPDTTPMIIVICIVVICQFLF